MQTLIDVFCFQSGQNHCKLSGQKSVLYWWWKKNKACFGILRCNPCGNLPGIFCV